MTSERTRLWDLCSLLGNAASLHVLCILTADWPDPADLRGLLIWWGVLTAAWILMNLAGSLPELSRTIPAIAIASLAAQIFLTVTYGQTPASFRGWLWLFLIWALPAYRAAEFIYRPESAEQRMLDFEFCLLSLIILTAAIAGGKGGTSALPPVLFACVLTLVHLALRRGSSASGSSRFLRTAVTCLIPAVLIFAGVLIFLSVKGPLAYGIRRITDTAIWGIREALSAAGRFLTWLFSLLPELSQGETVLPEPETQAALSVDMTETTSGDVIMTPLLLGFLGIAGAALLLMGTQRILPLPAAYGRRWISRLSLRAILTGALQRLKAAVHFRICCIRYRSTPEGLLCRIEAVMARRRAGRRQDESPHSFLDRVAGSLPDQAPELLLLAEWLDRRYFSAGRYDPPQDEFLRVKRVLFRLF